MKASALILLAAVGLLGFTPAKADWFGAPPFGFAYDGTYYFPGGPYRASPYIVAGWGDDGYLEQRRYWGGPFFVDLRGYHPPYQSYAVPRHHRRKHAH